MNRNLYCHVCKFPIEDINNLGRVIRKGMIGEINYHKNCKAIPVKREVYEKNF